MKFDSNVCENVQHTLDKSLEYLNVTTILYEIQNGHFSALSCRGLQLDEFSVHEIGFAFYH